MRSKITESQELEIIKKYVSGESRNSLAIEYRAGQKTINAIFFKHNIKLKTPSERLRTYYCNHNIFDELSYQSAYWLGFFAADGCITSNSNQLTLALAEKDISHLIKFKEFLESEHPLKKKIIKLSYEKIGTREYTAWEFRIRSYEIVKAMLKYNITPKKSLTLEFPNLPEEYIRSFILGYFDGDGTIGFYQKKLYFKLVSTYSFLIKVQEHLMKMCDATETKLIKRGDNGTFILSYNGNISCAKIYEYLYDSKIEGCYLNRKYQIFDKFKKDKDELKLLQNLPK